MSSEISTLTPDFVITEHSIKKNHKTYYEKREAKAYNMDEKNLRLDVKITRCIGDFCLIVSISQSGANEIFVHEQTNLSEKGLREFKEQWNTNWRPVLPRDDGLTPLMLTICNLEPYFPKPDELQKGPQDFPKNTENQVEPGNTDNAEPKSGKEEKLPIPEKNIILQKSSTKKDQIEESSKNSVQFSVDQRRTARKENMGDDQPKTGKEQIAEKDLNTSIEEPIPANKTGSSELDRIASLEERVATLEEQVRILTEMSKRLHEIILEH